MSVAPSAPSARPREVFAVSDRVCPPQGAGAVRSNASVGWCRLPVATARLFEALAVPAHRAPSWRDDPTSTTGRFLSPGLFRPGGQLVVCLP